MKEATGEVSMTVIVIVAVAVIGGILAAMWPQVKTKIQTAWGGNSITCTSGTWDPTTQTCKQ